MRASRSSASVRNWWTLGTGNMVGRNLPFPTTEDGGRVQRDAPSPGVLLPTSPIPQPYPGPGGLSGTVTETWNRPHTGYPAPTIFSSLGKFLSLSPARRTSTRPQSLSSACPVASMSTCVPAFPIAVHRACWCPVAASRAAAAAPSGLSLDWLVCMWDRGTHQTTPGSAIGGRGQAPLRGVG